MKRIGLLLGWALLFSLTEYASARPVLMIAPDQLIDWADLVCNGEVIDVAKTERKGEVVLHGNKGLAAEWWKARIKVLSVFKGSAPAEIEMTFPQLDWVKVKMVTNGPMQVVVEKEKRYLFYLKAGPSAGKYVGVLDGEFDDGSAVQALAENAPDNIEPLGRDEALQMADARVAKQQNFSGHVWKGDGNFSSWPTPSWQFNYFDAPPLSYPDFTFAAQVIVRSDHSIDPHSWIGTEFPRLNPAITQKDVSHTVRITQEIDRGEIATICGVVEKVDDATVTVRAAFGCSNAKAGEEVKVPRKELRSLQIGHAPE